jgi:hypothetical protein
MSFESVHTWFFESLSHSFPNCLEIKLVEGIRMPEAVTVEPVPGKTIGPTFPIQVLERSRCLSVTFEGVVAYQAVDESHGSPQSDCVCISSIGPVKECEALEYQNYVERDSLVAQIQADQYKAYFLWSSDQCFFVLSTETPRVEFADASPDLTIERGNCYSTH